MTDRTKENKNVFLFSSFARLLSRTVWTSHGALWLCNVDNGLRVKCWTLLCVFQARRRREFYRFSTTHRNHQHLMEQVLRERLNTNTMISTTAQQNGQFSTLLFLSNLIFFLLLCFLFFFFLSKYSFSSTFFHWKSTASV